MTDSNIDSVNQEQPQEEQPNEEPVPLSYEEKKALIQELFQKYVQPSEETLNKEELEQLVVEYEQLSGEPTGNTVELIQSINAETEQYTVDQVLEVMAPHIEETPEENKNEKTELEKINEQSPPLKLQVSKEVFERLQAAKSKDIENLSPQILEHKFKKHREKIEYSFCWITRALIEIYKGESEGGLQQLIDIFDNMFAEGNFVIAELSSVIQNEGEIEAPSKEIAKYVMRQKPDLSMLSVEQILEWLKSFIEGRPTAIVIDTINEFSCYGGPETDSCEKPEKIEAETDKQGEDKFIENLKGTIQMYQKILVQQTENGEDTNPTKKLLSSLKAQLSSYIKEKQGIFDINNYVLDPRSKKPFTKHERRAKALEEIFHFYAKQRFQANGRKTFDALVEEQNQLILGYVSKFLKDFGVTLEPNQVKALFAKTAVAGKYLDLSSFTTMIERVAMAIHKNKIDELEKDKKAKSKELAAAKKQSAEADTEEQKQEIPPAVEKAQTELAQIIAQVNELKRKKEEDVIEEFNQVLEIYEPAKYRKKMAGFERKPFFTKEKDTERMPPTKPKPPLPANYKPYIPGSKNNKGSEKQDKSRDQSRGDERVPKPKKMMVKAPSAASIKLPAKIGYSKRLYSKDPIMPKQNPAKVLLEEVKEPPAKKLTWNGLEGLSYRDIKGNEDFNPASLIVSDNKEDPELAQILDKFAQDPVADKKSTLVSKGYSPKAYFNYSSTTHRKCYGKYAAKMQNPQVLIPNFSLAQSGSNRHLYGRNEGKTPSLVDEKSYELAKQIDSQRQLKEGKNLQHIMQMQNMRIQKGLNVVKKSHPALLGNY